MRKVTLIGRVMVVATTGLTLTALSPSAEARGFRLRFGLGSAAARTSPPATRPPARAAAAGTPVLLAPSIAPRSAVATPAQAEIRASDAADAAPATAPTARPGIAEAARSAAQPVRIAGPWCPPERIVGAGAGFCQVN